MAQSLGAEMLTFLERYNGTLRATATPPRAGAAILNSVELAYAGEPEVAQVLADVRRELDGDAN